MAGLGRRYPGKAKSALVSGDLIAVLISFILHPNQQRIMLEKVYHKMLSNRLPQFCARLCVLSGL